ncbi:MAG: PH domain-containing protein [Patescibacteria group bacterium]
MKIFSIFNETNNTFEGKEYDENVLLLVRRHPFYILLKLAFVAFLFICPLIFISIYSAVLSGYDMLIFSVFVYMMWCLVLWQIIFYSITMYVLDVWIVTDKRVIDSTQHGFFNRTVAELHVARIQDISVNITGFFQTLFKFGDLEIQTAGTENKFDFLQIPYPNEVKNQIMSHISDKIHHSV